MILDTTSKVIELILSAVKTTNDCEYTADYVDTTNGATFAPGGTLGVSNGTTLVTAVSAPAASTQRAVRAFTFFNADTVNTTVTVRLYDGTNRRRIVTTALGVGQSLVFTPEAGWSILPASPGQIPGTTTNDNAAVGNVGEWMESIIATASPVTAFANGVAKNLTSLTLTPGDWTVEGLGSSQISAPATASIVSYAMGLSLVTNTLPVSDLRTFNEHVAGAANENISGVVPRRRFSVSVNTPVYLVLRFGFTLTQVDAVGFINAQRIR